MLVIKEEFHTGLVKAAIPSTVIHVLTAKGVAKASEITGAKVISILLKNENREYRLAHHLMISQLRVVLEAACCNKPEVELLGLEGRDSDP